MPHLYYEEVEAVLNRVRPSWAEAQDIALLFNYHNLIWPNIPEYSTTCLTCRSRVYNRLLKWYNDLRAEKQLLCNESSQRDLRDSQEASQPVRSKRKGKSPKTS